MKILASDFDNTPLPGNSIYVCHDVGEWSVFAFTLLKRYVTGANQVVIILGDFSV